MYEGFTLDGNYGCSGSTPEHLRASQQAESTKEVIEMVILENRKEPLFSSSIDLTSFTEDQIREMAREMAWRRYRVLSLAEQHQLLDSQFQREQRLNNDLTTMTRGDFERAIVLLSMLGVPVP